ncbi:MAG: CRTAC1 family protein, partial [Acidobacteriota bacterium]
EERRFCGDAAGGTRGYCHPDVYPGTSDVFLRGDGRGGFVDASEAAGIAGPQEAGLGVLFVDLDDDGDPDVYVANDLDPNLLFLNLGEGVFEDASLLSGTALGDRGKAEAGMGVIGADFDGDLTHDVFVTNFALETNALYRNLGDGLFTDARFQSKLAEPSHRMLGFGAAAVDIEHDGDLDVVVGNGHTIDNLEALGDTTSSYAMPNQLFVNDGRGVFRENEASGLSEVLPSRGLAVGDLDGDGDQDLVVVNSNERAEVYENLWGAERGRFFRVRLSGRQSNAQGVGARLTATRRIDGASVAARALVTTGSSYLSQNETVVHFGLDSSESVALEVRWPSGVLQRFVDLPSNVTLTVAEPPLSQ